MLYFNTRETGDIGGHKGPEGQGGTKVQRGHNSTKGTEGKQGDTKDTGPVLELKLLRNGVTCTPYRGCFYSFWSSV